MIPNKTLADFYTDADREIFSNIESIKATGERLGKELKSLQVAQAEQQNPDRDPDARINSLISGTPLPQPTSWESQILEKRKALRDVDRALDTLAAKKRRADAEANQRLLTDIRPAHDAAAKTLAETMKTAHEAWLSYFAAKRHLAGHGLSLGGLFQIDAEPLLGIPRDKGGNGAEFFRDCVKHKFLRAMPDGLK